MINLEENSCFEFLSFARKFGNFSSNLFLVKIGAILSDAKNQGKREGNSSDANERKNTGCSTMRKLKLIFCFFTRLTDFRDTLHSV